MYYSGESNVPGAPGNLFAGGNFLGGQGSAINPEAFKKDSRQQKIYNKGMGTDNPNEREIFLKRTGPQLPMAYGLDSSTLIAQAYPGGQALGNAAALGGQMGVGPQNYEAMMQQMQQMEQQGGGQPPVNFGVDIENEKVKNLRGNVRAQLDKNQSVNFGGQYNVQDQSGRFGLGYQTPTFGFDVNVTRTQPMPGMPGAGGYGAMMNMGGRF
jgi:hypothetical protein